MQKPGRLVILPIEELPCAILHLKLRDIPGIGPNMAERPQKAGITDIATLWKTDASMVAERTRLLLGKEVRGGCEHTTGGGGAADAQDRPGWPLSSSALTAEWIPAVEAEVGCVSFRSQSTTEHFCESRVLPRADRHDVARRRVPMSTRFSISLLLSMMVSAVLFGIGATIVLSIPRLSEHAPILLPIVILLSFIFAPFCSWVIAPKLRAKYSRQVEAKRAVAGERRRLAQ